MKEEELTRKDVLPELFKFVVGIACGVFAGFIWHFGGEALIVGTIFAMVLMWKDEWNRKFNLN